MTRVSIILLGSLFAACMGSAPPDGGGGGGGGGDGGGGGGGGNGSGSGSGGGGGNVDTSGVANFLHEIGKKYCDQAFTCKASFPTDAGVTFDQAFGTSAMQCYTDSDAANDTPTIVAQINGGTITWNQADATACLAGLTFPACAQFWQQGGNEPAACGTALVGHVADGGACVSSYECTNLMSYCDATSKKCTVDANLTAEPAEELARDRGLRMIHHL